MTRHTDNLRRLADWWLDRTLAALPPWLTATGPEPARWRWTGEALVPLGRPRVKGPWCLVLDDARPLVLFQDLPGTAIMHLRRIVGLQLGHWTPLTPENTFYAATLDGPAAAGIRVKLTVLPRAAAAPALAAAVAMAMPPPHQVQVPGAILPVAEPPSTRRLPPRLLLLALLLLVPPLAMGVVQQSRIAQLRLEMDATTMLGTQARDLGLRVERLRARTLEAVTARQQAPSLLLLLDRLSQTLPDGSYLTELRWEEGRLHLSGYSRDGAGLPALLDASPYLEDVRFEAALLRAGPEGDRFQLSLKAAANVTD